MFKVADRVAECVKSLSSLGKVDLVRMDIDPSDPKEAWKRLHKKYIDVYRNIVNMPKDELEMPFPQQMRGLSKLMGSF